MSVNLAKYRKPKGLPGRNRWVVGWWYVCNRLFFRSAFFPFSGLKAGILRIFGAEVGRGVVIKPNINIKYPWRLEVGDHVWLGEGVWIDNLAEVRMGDHVCISQGAMLLTGNHDYTRPHFDLITGPITLENGVWIGAKALVGPGVVAQEHAVLCAGSVATKNLDAWMVCRGNPAVAKKRRVIQ